MFHSIRFVVAVSVCLGAMAVSSQAKDYFVDQKHPKADDKNGGTEALPFKTIQPVVDVAKPGDKIWIKQGGYDGFVQITTSGTRGRPITLSAWKEDYVQIGFIPRPLPVEGEWKPVEGTKSFQIKLKEDVPQDFIVVLNDKAQKNPQDDDNKPRHAAQAV